MIGGGLAIERERRGTGDGHALGQGAALNVGQGQNIGIGLNIDHVLGHGQDQRGSGFSVVFVYYNKFVSRRHCKVIGYQINP